jgi:hypothetical protein
MIMRFALACALLLPNLTNAASCCEQRFTVLGIEGHGCPQLWFQVSMKRDCYSEVIWQLTLDGDSVSAVQSQHLGVWEKSHDWSQIDFEKPHNLDYSNGIYTLGDTITVTSPRYDFGFERQFRRLARETADASGRGWRKFCKSDCLDEPVVSGADIALLYEHPTGIYKNYLVYDATYFASQQLLVVVTYQPIRGDGLDAMHGLLVYKLIPQYDGETNGDVTGQEK